MQEEEVVEEEASVKVKVSLRTVANYPRYSGKTLTSSFPYKTELPETTNF